MNILMTGGTGFIGRQLISELLANAQTQPVHITVLTRNPVQAKRTWPNNSSHLHFIGQLNELDDNAHIDAVINLAGEGIADKRWTPARKQVLAASRITVTENLVNWLRHRSQKPSVFISGSAVGWYGNQGDTLLDEQSAPHMEYVHSLCHLWESAALEASSLGLRVCIIRTGIVIGQHGGFLQRLRPIFSMGLGGPLGNGRQYLSWVALSDVTGIIQRLLSDSSLDGRFNVTAPNPVTNNEFTKTLAAQLNRPAFFRVPAFVIRLALGEMATLLVDGQRVIPQRLLQVGYTFKYPTLASALDNRQPDHFRIPM